MVPRRIPSLSLLLVVAACTSPVEEQVVPSAWSLIAVGLNHVCGIAADGGTYCWGSNLHGQLGTGSGSLASTVNLQRVDPSRSYTRVSAGGAHSCALDAEAVAFCWGGDDTGQLGIGRDRDDDCALSSFNTFPCKRAPEIVQGGLRFAAIAAGLYHTCGLTELGAAYCWGLNSLGQLGLSSVTDTCGATNLPCSPTPVAVSGDLRFASLALGSVHSCALTAAGQAYCWGSNQLGGLGTATLETCTQDARACSTTPLAVAPELTFTALAAGSDHTCALADGGQVYCWGANESGQAGATSGNEQCPQGPCVSRPVLVEGGLPFAAVAAGGRHSCALAADGRAYCWGYAGDGALGSPTAESRATPGEVSGGLFFSQISAGAWNTCAITTDQRAFCWGSNANGQLGSSEVLSQTFLPLQVTGR